MYWDLKVPNTNNYVTADGAVHHNSGKSVACCMEIVLRALQQRPGPDGKRRSRWAVIRNSYPELQSTTIKTWTDWFKPEVFGKVKQSAPITHTLRLANDCELEVMFLALDRPDDAKKLLSLELTGVWLNEARELPKAVLDAASGRVGRFPSKRDGGPSWYGVIMDTNPCADDHWWYRLAEEERPDGFDFFRQPSGLSAQAENTFNLPEGYYTRLLAGKSQDWIKVYVEAQYGSIAEGRPVYPEFNDTIHVAAAPLQPYRGLPLYAGFDFGLTPACTFVQVSSRGQLRVLDELVSENMGLTQFVDNVVKPFLALRYPGMKVLSLIDPAGVQRSQADEKTCRDILKKAGLHPSAATTNNFTARREAVAAYLSRLIDGEPGFLMSPTCKTLRKGMNGDYKFKRVQIPGEERYKDVPDKTMSSHVCESLQYVCLHTGGPRVSAKKQPTRASRYTAVSQAGY